MDRERRKVLDELNKFLWKFGDANDAQDHNCGPEAEKLRRDATAGIRELMVNHPYIIDLFPSLGAELESKRIEWWTWSNLVDAVQRELND